MKHYTRSSVIHRAYKPGSGSLSVSGCTTYPAGFFGGSGYLIFFLVGFFFPVPASAAKVEPETPPFG